MNSSIKFYVHKRNFFLILFETGKKCESILLFSYSTWCERHIYISLITCQITLSLTLQCFSISTNIMIFLEIYIPWKEHLINIFIGFGCYDQVFNFPNEPKSKKKHEPFSCSHLRFYKQSVFSALIIHVINMKRFKLSWTKKRWIAKNLSPYDECKRLIVSHRRMKQTSYLYVLKKSNYTASVLVFWISWGQGWNSASWQGDPVARAKLQ